MEAVGVEIAQAFRQFLVAEILRHPLNQRSVPRSFSKSVFEEVIEKRLWGRVTNSPPELLARAYRHPGWKGDDAGAREMKGLAAKCSR